MYMGLCEHLGDNPRSPLPLFHVFFLWYPLVIEHREKRSLVNVLCSGSDHRLGHISPSPGRPSQKKSGLVALLGNVRRKTIGKPTDS